MAKKLHCGYCGAELDAGRVFSYEFESLEFIDDEDQLQAIREDSRFYGEPLPTCSACAKSLEMNQLDQEEDRRIQEKQQSTLYIAAFLFSLAFFFLSFFWLF